MIFLLYTIPVIVSIAAFVLYEFGKIPDLHPGFEDDFKKLKEKLGWDSDVAVKALIVFTPILNLVFAFTIIKHLLSDKKKKK